MNILVDWGGTISRDETIVKIRRNYFKQWYGPKNWEEMNNLNHIQSGVYNFDNGFFSAKKLEEIKNSFFSSGEIYPDSDKVISKYCENNCKISAKTNIYIVFDNVPNINVNQSEIIKQMAFSFDARGIKTNGYYVDSDKIHLSKQIGVDIVIEDDPRVAIALCLAGIKCVLVLRRWNRLFSINSLYLTMKEEKIKKIEENLFFAEDWKDAENIVDWQVQISS